MKFASLCILAYKRSERLAECLSSLHRTIDFPAEIIINIDGMSDEEQKPVLDVVLQSPGYSKLISVSGKNRGVGRSFQNCLGVAEGDYILKIDTDLIFRNFWLSQAIKVLDDHTDVGAVSLFDYKHYNPKETRFNVIEKRLNCFIVDDFVSSIFAFRKGDAEAYLESHESIPDDGFHQWLGQHPLKLAVTREDFVTNNGFGLGKSVYVVADSNGNPTKAKTHDMPRIFS